MSQTYPLRPFLPQDVVRLQDILAQSIEELTQDEYDEDQRLAWMSGASDAQAFGERLAKNLTLIVERDGEILGFASLKDNTVVDLLFVHPYAAGEGVGTALLDALEKLATARGADALTADVSDTAHGFFEGRGYVPVQRNNIPIGDAWLTSTTMSKPLKPKPSGAP